MHNTKSGDTFAAELFGRSYKEDYRCTYVLEHIPAMQRLATPGQRQYLVREHLDFWHQWL